MNASQQSDLTSRIIASNINATPISSMQLSQRVNRGVIQESGMSHSGDINFIQPNLMQSQYRHTGATCHPTGAFTLPQKHNTLGNMTTVSHNMVGHNVIHAPRSDTAVGIHSTAGNNDMVTSEISSYVNTHNSVNTDSTRQVRN